MVWLQGGTSHALDRCCCEGMYSTSSSWKRLASLQMLCAGVERLAESMRQAARQAIVLQVICSLHSRGSGQLAGDLGLSLQHLLSGLGRWQLLRDAGKHVLDT